MLDINNGEEIPKRGKIIDMNKPFDPVDPTDEVDGTDKRVHTRFRVNLKVYIRLSDGSIIHGQGTDISKGGGVC